MSADLSGVWDEFFGGKEPTLEELLNLQNKPEVYSAMKDTLADALGIDLSTNIVEEVLNSEEVRKAIKDVD